VHSFSRRAPTSTDAKLQALVSTDNSQWPATLASLSPPPSIFFSALGTPRGASGRVEAQRKIDYDLNLDLARAAKTAGVKVYVLISSGGANSKSALAYPRMKGELEESVKQLGFERTIILRPGLLLGDRSDSRPAEWVMRKIAGGFGLLGHRALDFWAQDAAVVAKAAISAGLQALGDDMPKLWELGMSDIVRLGRTEWKD
jgi:uncharacterized protein YbjT (DUF2867 family)